MFKENLASCEFTYFLDCFNATELEQCREFAAETIFVEHEGHKDAINAADEVLAVSAVPDIVREIEGDFAFYSMRLAQRTYFVNVGVVYH
jgi:hypothetical protein